MTKNPRSGPASSPPVDPLAESINGLTAEVRVLHETIDKLREDFSWVTRNGLPVQPIEHVHVKRMARDPCAGDWKDRPEIERSTYPADGSSPQLDVAALDRIAESLSATVEAVAQGQLEVVLNAIDGVRNELLTALERRRQPAAVEAAVSLPPRAAPAPEQPKERPRRGQLF